MVVLLARGSKNAIRYTRRLILNFQIVTALFHESNQRPIRTDSTASVRRSLAEVRHLHNMPGNHRFEEFLFHCIMVTSRENRGRV